MRLPLLEGEMRARDQRAAYGRGARTNQSGRFERERRSDFDDGWGSLLGEDDSRQLTTHVTQEFAKTILTRNTSPDIPFDRSINPYRGCEHGCVYCFARPTHSYLGLSAGLDFETKLFSKSNAAERLRETLNKPGYKAAPIAIGTNTDPYQPIEGREGVMRQILEVLQETRHPVTIVTKSRMVVRDLDILREMAAQNLVKVALSVTTLDHKLARAMEPRASMPQRRLDAIRLLTDAGVPTAVMVAPVIPAVNDHEIETILAAAAHAGAREAAYILVRLPNEIRDLFADWLEEHMPDRKARVLARLTALRGGRLNDPRYGSRMRGDGAEANILKARFNLAARKAGLATAVSDRTMLDTSRFQRPTDAQQMSLF